MCGCWTWSLGPEGSAPPLSEEEILCGISGTDRFMVPTTKASAPTRERRAATAHSQKNLLTDDRVKAMLAAVSSGNLDELRILRYRGAQIKGWSQTKVGNENVMRNIVHEGIEVPTSFIDRRNPPGRANPEDY